MSKSTANLTDEVALRAAQAQELAQTPEAKRKRLELQAQRARLHIDLERATLPSNAGEQFSPFIGINLHQAEDNLRKAEQELAKLDREHGSDSAA